MDTLYCAMRALPVCLVAAVVFGMGCGKREVHVVGSWRVDPASLPKGVTPAGTAALRAMVMEIGLEFRPDKTFTCTMTGAGRTTRFEGSYVLSGHTAAMTTTRVNGIDSRFLVEGVSSDRDPPRQGPLTPWRADLSDDSGKLTLTFMGTTSTFIRSS